MINLSFSTIDNLYKASHTWTNKINGCKTPDRPYYQKGKEIHTLLQNHFLGISQLEIPQLKDLTFEIVEREDFDTACYVTYPINEKYQVHGYIDGLSISNNSTLEIKSGASYWSLPKYKNSMQRKTYSLCLPEVKKNTLITVLSNIDSWNNYPPKVFTLEATEKDRQDALKWFLGAIEIIESGDLEGGLLDGYCTGCNYAENCLFYRRKE